MLINDLYLCSKLISSYTDLPSETNNQFPCQNFLKDRSIKRTTELGCNVFFIGWNVNESIINNQLTVDIGSIQDLSTCCQSKLFNFAVIRVPFKYVLISTPENNTSIS